MLLSFLKFGGIAPKVYDPRLLPDGKAQTAKNCRFDHGGIMPLGADTSVATPTKPGTLISIYLYQDQYWFAWTTDVNAVLTPISNDSWNRVFFTEGGVLKVCNSTNALTGGTNYPNASTLPSPPAPTDPITAAISGVPTDPDPSKGETRYYTYTYVNSYGDEGPPCEVSNKVTWLTGQVVVITTTETIPAGAYGLSAVRVYRLNRDASGSSSQMQFVYETPVANLASMPTDAVDSAALGEVLQTTEWDGAPSGVTGLITLPNAGLACYTGNTLCLSVPGYPHAFPVGYRKTTERPIMGLVAFGNTVIALTTGVPEAVTFTDPGNSVPEKVPTGHACSSKRSVVDMGDFYMYASSEGLVAIGPGLNKITTADLFAREDWQAYKPDSISGYMWQGKYVGFYNTGAVTAGFIYDPSNGDFQNLDFYATAGYRDTKTEILYLQIGADVKSFATSATPRTLDNVSRRETFKPTVFTAIKVLATAYPVTVDVKFPLARDTNGIAPQTQTVSVTSSQPQRLASTDQLVDALECRVYGTKGCTAVYVASTIEELPQ